MATWYCSSYSILWHLSEIISYKVHATIDAADYALDDLVKSPDDNPSVGRILCRRSAQINIF